MKKISVTLIMAACSFLPLFSQDTGFKEFANQESMTFIMPKNFTSVPVIQNRNVRYDFAIKHNKKKLEIRYALFSLKKRILEYEKSKNNPNVVMTDPNKGYTAFTYASCLNISGGQPFKGIRAFKPADVKKEFNADWGATILIEPKSDFGKGYKYILAVSLHKDSISDVFIFYLFDDIKKISPEMQKAFHALTYGRNAAK